MENAKKRSLSLLVVAALVSTTAAVESGPQPGRGPSYGSAGQVADDRISILSDDIASHMNPSYGRVRSLQFTVLESDDHAVVARVVFASGRAFTVRLKARENGRLAAEFPREAPENKTVQIDCKSLRLEIEEPDGTKPAAKKIGAAP